MVDNTTAKPSDPKADAKSKEEALEEFVVRDGHTVFEVDPKNPKGRGIRRNAGDTIRCTRNQASDLMETGQIKLAKK